MDKFKTLFLRIFKAKSPAKKPKHGFGKHKEGILVRTASGKVVTEQRTVGVKTKEKKKPIQPSLMAETQPVAVSKPSGKGSKVKKEESLPSPPPPTTIEKPKRGQPAGLRKHAEWKKQEKRNNEISANLGKHLEGVDMGEFEDPRMEYPSAPKKKKEKPKPIQSIAEKEKEVLAEKPKKGSKSKKAEPVKPIASIGKQGLKSSKQRQEAEARQGMFDEEGDLAQAMRGDGKPKPIQSIAEKEKEVLAEKPKKKKGNADALKKFHANKKDSDQLDEARRGMFDEEGDLAQAMRGESKKKDWVKDYIKDYKHEPMDSVLHLEDDDEHELIDDSGDTDESHAQKLNNLHSVLSNAGINAENKNGKVSFTGVGGKKYHVTPKDTGSIVPRANGENHHHIQYEVTNGKDSTGTYDHLHDLIESHFGKKLGGAMIDSAHDNSPELSKALSKEYRDTKAHLQANPSVSSKNSAKQVTDPKTSYFKLGGHEGTKRTKAEMNALQKHAIDNGARYTGHGDIWSINRDKEGHDALIDKHGGAMKRAYVKPDNSKIESKANSVGKLEGKLESKKNIKANEKDSNQLADARQGMFDEEGDLARAMSGNEKPSKTSKPKSSKQELADRKRSVAETKKQLAQNDKTIRNMKKEGSGYHSGLDQGDYASPNAPDPLAKKPSESIQKLKEATASANQALAQVGAKPKPSSKTGNIKQATAEGKKALEQVGSKPKPVQPSLTTTTPPPPKPSAPVSVKNVAEKPTPAGYTGSEYKGKTYIDQTHDTVNMSEGQKNRLGVQKDEKGKHFVDFSKLDSRNHSRAVADLDKHKQTPVKVTYGSPRK